jgi:hypothetical protein
VLLAAGAIALLKLLRDDPRVNPPGRFAGALTLAFALIFFFLNSLTGWIYFGWYGYPLPAAAIASFVFISQGWVAASRAPRTAAATVLATVVLVPVLAARAILREPWPAMVNQRQFTLGHEHAEARGTGNHGSQAA